MTDEIHHIAIQDDWEMSRGFGEYEVSTRGVPLDDVGYIHATVADGVDAVLRSRYADLTLPLLDIVIRVDALEAAGVPVEWHDGHPRILGTLPMSPDVIVSEAPIAR